MRMSDWSSDVCSSDLGGRRERHQPTTRRRAQCRPHSPRCRAMIAGIVSAEAGAGFADGVVAGRAAGSVAKPLGDGSASSQKLHPLAFRNPSNVLHPIPKYSQKFGIFAAFGFRRPCVTTDRKGVVWGKRVLVRV